MVDVVITIVESITKEKNAPVTGNSKLVGNGAVLDSMGLVELCIRLEDLALGEGFQFDWASESAMSRSASIFKNVESLAAELVRQKGGPS